MEDKERAKGKEVDEKRRHIEWLSKTSLSGQSGNQPKAKTIRVNMISDLLGQAEDYPNLASPGSSDTKTGPGFYSEPKRLYSAPVLAELIQVESKQAELQKAKLELIKLIEEVVGDFRLAGDAHYINYEFTKALRTYQGGLKYVTKDEIPTLWADMQILIGNANNEIANHSDGPAIAEHRQAALAAYEQSLIVYTKDVFPEAWTGIQNNLANALTQHGIRIDGVESTRLLSEAVAAYRAALTVHTKEQLPQAWAMTQMNLAIALQNQGTRTGGPESIRLLGEAVAAYRAALTVRTKEQLPQDWAITQMNLGTALSDQGVRTGGEEGRQLLAQAVAAYRQALTVRTREHLPEGWAQTHNNLANAALSLQDWPTAAESYRNVLTLYPDYTEVYQMASSVYHDKLFAYTSAFELSKQWLERHPEDLYAQANFAESHWPQDNMRKLNDALESC